MAMFRLLGCTNQLFYTSMRPALLTLRRSLRYLPRSIPTKTLPSYFARPITFQAAQSADEAPPSDPSGSGTNFELVAGSSQHPFANAYSAASSSTSSSSSSDQASSSTGQHEGGSGEGVSVVEKLPQPPPPTPPIPVIKLQHPFDTHAFVTYLERSEINRSNAVVLMEAVRELIVRRKTKALDTMVNKEDMENAAYLFRAALSELRAELSVRAKSDSLALKQATLAIRRDIDSLEQKIKEDVQTLKHDIEMDMNNRKSETRSEQKLFDLQIEEINNKFTISLGDLRTEIESAKWESVRRAMSILVILVVSVVGASLVAAPEQPVPAAAPVKAVPIMKDMAVGTDDEDFEEEEVDTKLERLLSREMPVRSKPRKQKKELEKLDVDRI